MIRAGKIRPPLPSRKPETLTEAYAQMRCPDFLRAPSHRDNKVRTVKKRADRQVEEFARRFVRRCEKAGIPVYIAHLDRYGVSVRHGYIPALDMDAKHWDILGHLGEEICVQYKLQLKNDRSRWPGVWKLSDDYCPF